MGLSGKSGSVITKDAFAVQTVFVPSLVFILTVLE